MNDGGRGSSVSALFLNRRRQVTTQGHTALTRLTSFKDVQMPPITIELVRFRIDHDHNYQGSEPIMKLISKKGYVTAGFLRGTNLAVGQIVHAQSSDGLHHWTGWITAKGLEDFFSKIHPTKPAWFFVLYAMREYTGGKPGDGVTVTVTVTDPNNQTQTGSTTADPTPQISDVP
jgi:hypothetical protein